MSDAYNFIYSDDPRTGALTYPQLEARRKIAIALATRNRPYPKTIGEGLTALGEGLGEGMYNSSTARAEAAYQRQTDEDVRRLTGGGGATSATAAPPVAAAPQVAPDKGPLTVYDPIGGGTQALALAAPDTGPVFDPAKLSPEDRRKLEQARAYSGPQMPIEEWKQRIARNESGLRKDAYTLVGERSRRGDYPYGKYQVMGENIPKWTKQYVGREMTPQEFLADPDAQETVASGQGGKYLAKYGPEGAGAAWFAGEGGMNDPNRKDTLGTHVAEYRRRFNIPLASRDQVVASAAKAPAAQAFASEDGPPVQVASLGGGMPTPDTAPDPREAIAQSLAGPQPAQPQQAPSPMPVQVAQAQQQIGRPPPTSPPEVVPRYTAPTAQQGPPAMPDQTPITKQEMDIRRAIGATTDPVLKGRLEPVAERMEAERKFKDTQNMAAWQKDYSAWEKRTDPLQQAQLRKAQEEEAQRARALRREQERGGVSQEIIDKGIEANVKIAGPLREASAAVNQVEDLLNKGMFTGTLGKAELAAAKVKSSLGFPTDPRIASTEAFSSAVKPIVAAARQALAGGANISDRDMRAAEAAAGGDITLNKESIQQIMQSVRTIQLQTAMHHQQMLATAAGSDQAAQNTLYGLHGLPMEQIIPKNHPTVQRLMEKADNEHERELFNSAWKTPGLAEKIIIRNRAPR